MHNGDVLGDEGRKALNACVKVKIYGKPETRRYDRWTAMRRLTRCYAHRGCQIDTWCFDKLVLPSDECGNFGERTYDIVDIHDALVDFDKKKCVEKYPKEGQESVKQRDLIDKRRADVERELEEANANPDCRLRYSWLVAQRRVRDCFAGNFAEDRWTLDYRRNDSYNVVDIYKSFVSWDQIRERAEAKRASLLKEYAEATAAENVKLTLPKYSQQEALQHMMYYELRSCLYEDEILPVKMCARGSDAQSYDVFDMYKALVKFDGKLLEKYPKEGPGSEELKKSIDKHRANLEEEYQKAKSHESGSLPKYSRNEAERRVRDCFAGTFPSDGEIIPKKEEDKSDQTYDIVDIKNAIEHFDTKTLLDACKYASKRQLQRGYATNQEVDELRASLQEEYDEATSRTEIEHGSGFIIHGHFVITNKHVIETYLNETDAAVQSKEKGKHEICISNAEIGELSCTKVVHNDAGKDLALLYCPDLKLEQCKICPLQLSNQASLPGMSIFSFGYPISHTGKTALFVTGNVSGFRETLAGHSMIVLNCSLNSGNSGGPVLRWVNGELKVVGVATQKHFKEILTLEEIQTIENIRESLQTKAISDVPVGFKECSYNFIESSRMYHVNQRNHKTPMTLLTLKLYDALETHSQFNLSNALPGSLVVDFMKDSINEYTGEHKEELAEIVELANQDHVSSSQCCIL